MHFGEYLVQEKILSAHQVLKALAEQRRRRVFLPLLLVDMDALEDYRSLKYCSMANENGEDFLDVLVREGLISDDQRDRILKAWMNSGPPLGALCVEMGLMDEETRASTLEDFEAEKELEKNLARIS